tara:strand:+ start:651 stop:1181 length:531 start_codon:yes stop_codon:yes gene_type:complete
MIKLKTLLNEKFLGFGFGAGKIKEQDMDDKINPGNTSQSQANKDDYDYDARPAHMKQKEVKLDQLKFDELTKMFPKHYNDVHFTRMQPDGKEGPYYRDALIFPTPSDSSSVIGDMEALEDWKDKTKRRFGNVTVILDPDAKERWDMVKVEDDKFSQDKQNADSAKMSMLKQWGTTT